MYGLKSFFFLSVFIVSFFSCSQDDKTACACLMQAQKVNQFSTKIWSLKASHSDTMNLKKALIKKEKLCKSLQQSDPEIIQELKGKCNQK